MYAQKRVFNPQIFLEFVCYAAFAALMVYLAASGKYKSYVTPRMVPYLYFTAAVMAVWASGGLFRLFRPRYKTRAAHCLVLAIPILLLLLPHTPVNTSELSSGYLSGNVLTGLSGKSGLNALAGGPAAQRADGAGKADTSEDFASGWEADIPSEDTASTDMAPDPSNITDPDAQPDLQAEAQADSQADVQEAFPEDEYTTELPGLDVKNKKITVADDDFALWISEIFTEMGKYEGYRISIKGFVFKDPETMKENEFVPARLAMSCCVADLAPCGFICIYDKASGLKEDTWVTVEGVIHIGKYMDEDEPQISVTKISPAEEVEGYIYPY
jgi:putative membrane protein